jgi:phospholipid transport system substrate-binding protein
MGARSTRLSAQSTLEVAMGRLRVLAAVAVMTVVMTDTTGPAWAGAPTDQLRGRVERVLRALEDPELKQEGRLLQRRATIREIAYEIFDFRELSQRALARHWQARTQAERDEFVQLFAELLERTYIRQIEQYSGGERVQFLAESAEGDQATVRTKIVAKAGTEIPVDYRMHRVGERWLVYDVAIEGVSLVSNYRAQFDRIIRSSSYKNLADKLKAKKDEERESEAAGVKRASTHK